MKKVCWILVLVVLTSPAFAERVTIFKDLAKPAGFYLDNDHFYLIEFPHIYVYSLSERRTYKSSRRVLQDQGEKALFHTERKRVALPSPILSCRTVFKGDR